MTGGCPVMHDYTMMDQEFQRDPYALCPVLQESPVVYAPELDAYLVTRYADVQAILPDTAQFSSSNTNVPIFPPGEGALKVLKEADVHLPPNLINADPPRHTQVRKYVAEAISPRRIRALEPMVRRWAEDQIDLMIAKGGGDMFADLAFPMPAMTGFSLIGFPDEDLDLLKSWCDRRITFTYGRSSGEEQVRVAENVAAFWKYTLDFIAKRMEEPADDFTSDMVARHRENPESFTVRDIASVLFGVSLAAHETTTNLIVNGLRQLMEHRDQWDKLVADPTLIPNAVEETLRFDAPVIAWRRRAKEEVDISGVVVPKDATVLLLFFSANHDPARFENPDQFDIRRKDARNHITFGKGVHFCSGAPLARMEMKVVLELLTQKVPHMQLVEGQSFNYVPNIAMHAPDKLLVELSRQPIPVPA